MNALQAMIAQGGTYESPVKRYMKVRQHQQAEAGNALNRQSAIQGMNMNALNMKATQQAMDFQAQNQYMKGMETIGGLLFQVAPEHRVTALTQMDLPKYGIPQLDAKVPPKVVSDTAVKLWESKNLPKATTTSAKGLFDAKGNSVPASYNSTTDTWNVRGQSVPTAQLENLGLSMAAPKAAEKDTLWYLNEMRDGDLVTVGSYTQKAGDPPPVAPEGSYYEKVTREERADMREFGSGNTSKINLYNAYEKRIKDEGILEEKGQLDMLKAASKNGSAIDRKFLQTTLANMAGGKTRAVAELERFRASGSLGRRFADHLSDFFTGKITDESMKAAVLWAHNYERDVLRPKWEKANKRFTEMAIADKISPNQVVRPLEPFYNFENMTDKELENLLQKPGFEASLDIFHRTALHASLDMRIEALAK